MDQLNDLSGLESLVSIRILKLEDNDQLSSLNGMEDLSSLYQQFSQNENKNIVYITLPQLPINYVDYSAWQRNYLQGEVLEEKLAYWINAYNAYTLRFIVDNYPVKSIKKLRKNIFKGPWKRKEFLKNKVFKNSPRAKKIQSLSPCFLSKTIPCRPFSVCQNLCSK